MTEIRVQIDLDHPVDLVWRALTEPPLLARWFVEADLRPRVGAAFRLRAPGHAAALAGFDPVTLAEVTAVEPPYRLVMRWRSDQSQTLVTWELSTTRAGCRLSVAQVGFLGVRGTERRAALTTTYERLYGERLPAVLTELAGGPPAALAPLVPVVPRPAFAARLPAGRGGRWLAVAGVAAVVAAVGTALSGVLPNGTADPVEARPGSGTAPLAAEATSAPAGGGGRPAAGVPATGAGPTVAGPRVGGPGATGSSGPGAALAVGGPTVGAESASPPGGPDVPPPPAPGPAVLSATYRTINPGVLGLAAFQGGVTLTNTGDTAADGWSVAVTMPATPSAATADFVTNGTTHTFRGGRLAPGASIEFTYDVLLNLSLRDPRPTACSIGGTSCAGV